MARRRRYRGPIPRHPDAAERIYLRGMRSVVARSARITMVHLEPIMADWPEVTTDAIDGQDIRRALAAARADIREYLDGPELRRLLDRVSSRISLHTARDLERMLGEKIDRTAGSIASARTRWSKTNRGLISTMLTATGRTSLLGGIRTRLTESLSARAPVSTARAHVADRVRVARSHGALIATDQTLTLNGTLTRARQQAAEIEEYQWVSMRDDRVRDAHQELDGTIQRWDRPTSEGHPGDAVNCRCVAAPIRRT